MVSYVSDYVSDEEDEAPRTLATSLKDGLRESVAVWFPSNRSSLQLAIGLVGSLVVAVLALTLFSKFPVFAWIYIPVVVLKAPFEVRVLWQRSSRSFSRDG